MDAQQNGAADEDAITEEDQQTVIGETIPHQMHAAEPVMTHPCRGVARPRADVRLPPVITLSLLLLLQGPCASSHARFRGCCSCIPGARWPA